MFNFNHLQGKENALWLSKGGSYNARCYYGFNQKERFRCSVFM